MIVDYDYYTDTFKGNSVPHEEFERIELKASSQINKFIMNRDYTNFNNQDYSEQVKMATCSVIDILYDIDKKKKALDAMVDGKSNKIITSEKVKDYSRNYATTSYKELQEQVSNENVNKLIKEEIEIYLWNTGLLNRRLDYV